MTNNYIHIFMFINIFFFFKKKKKNIIIFKQIANMLGIFFIFYLFNI